MSSKPLQFGVLLLPSYQLLDAVGPFDYINNHTQSYLKMCNIPDAIANKGAHIVWHFISWDLAPVQPSSGPPQNPTCTYADCTPLDYLIVPGPDPTAPLPAGCAAFLQRLMAADTFKALLTVCTGSAAAAQSGVLDGRRVCSNKYVLRVLAGAGALNRRVRWVGDARWAVDGKVWSAAGVTAGIDLAAEFARVHFDKEVVELVKELSEYRPNPAQPDEFARILEGVDLA
ncbi:hypothetical protein HYPSUDRAFT_49377 [Hypholoma sublateritium FD-334 SS-4]|uniref:DJ-1/PfpI domain-containing protein n=1 Tax=Hypholoma sublateritium (strain FD-334 SS-4) TaxID=945553 RepID=A0A0D2KHY8_HYPSF|nr:hypothetical protein HYPSUDRAFT_49377 [Hypholoma sublateritium FD-334 SS-4]